MSVQHSNSAQRRGRSRQPATSKTGYAHALRDPTLLTDVSDGVLYVDENRVVFAANNAAARISGFSKTELRGCLLDTLVGRDVAASLCDAVLVRSHPIRLQDLTTVCRKDGTSSIAQGVARRMRLQSSSRVVRLVLRDVTLEQKLQDELQVSLQERRRAHEIERTRLSRKLHEEVLQDLLALAINLESFAQECTGGAARVRASDLASQTREIANYLRHISHSLRPRILDRMPVVAALRTLVNESQTSTLKSTLRVRGGMVPMPWYVESGIYRILLELLSNVRRHSGASEVKTTLAFRKFDVALTVQDNGKGFDWEPELSALIARGKQGIVGMHERVEYLGGTLHIDSASGNGTHVRVVVPYESEHARNYSRRIWPDVPDYLPSVSSSTDPNRP